MYIPHMLKLLSHNTQHMAPNFLHLPSAPIIQQHTEPNYEYNWYIHLKFFLYWKKTE